MAWPPVIVTTTKMSIAITGLKIIMILLAFAAIIYGIGKYLGYWKEDVWGKTDLGSDKTTGMQELDDFF